ncbi:MAG: peptide-methionine (S)-S-oxide reductase MsrA, partial [Polynucleobacter victoriensis]
MSESNLQKATLGGGCFWCLEAVYQQVRGVVHVESGYTGGQTLNPDYDSVCTGKTGHAEVVQIEFDAGVISYRIILDIFFAIHDPTTLNRQGNDIGSQYRSVIYAHDSQQRTIAQEVIQQLTKDNIFDRPIV